MHEGLVTGGACVDLGLCSRNSRLCSTAVIPCPVCLLVPGQARGVAKPFSAQAAAVVSSAPSNTALIIFRGSTASFASMAPTAAAILFTKCVEIRLVTGAELETDLEVG